MFKNSILQTFYVIVIFQKIDDSEYHKVVCGVLVIKSDHMLSKLGILMCIFRHWVLIFKW